MRVMLWVYDVITLVAVAFVYAPSAMIRRLGHGIPLRARERLGFLAPVGERHCVWIHAVSVGEAIAAAPIVEGVHRRYPGVPIVVTTVTETGARVVRDRYRGVAEHRFFPLDVPGAMRRAATALRPSVVVVMETELWPNALRALAARRIPVMIANGRVSDRSFRRYRLVRRFMRSLLRDVTVIAMQSEEDARRIVALGAEPARVHVTGNLKNEASADAPAALGEWRRILGVDPEQPVWAAGSTHRGEERLVLDAHQAACRTYPHLKLIVAPRHPERAEEVLELIRARGATAVRRSQLPHPEASRAIVVLDTLGELATVYALADVVFIGGSLVEVGGHNMLEAALRRKPVLTGPHTQNFREATTLLEAAGAMRVVSDADELAEGLQQLLADGSLRARMGAAGHQAVTASSGAVRKTLQLVSQLLESTVPAP